MKKTVVVFFLMINLIMVADFSAAQTTAKPFAVVELFTSEGCNSCPPADKVLSEIISDAKKNHKNIFCLQYHVDYFDRLEWKDPYGKSEFTQRQKNYSSVMHSPGIYLPQMIVNGETEFTGSYRDSANAAINKALKTAEKVSVNIKVDSVAHDSVYVHYNSSGADKNYSLRFAIVESNLVSKISKGENSGMTLKHDNVVRIFFAYPLKEKSGAAKIPLKGIKPDVNFSMIAFVQNKQTQKILGACQTDF